VTGSADRHRKIDTCRNNITIKGYKPGKMAKLQLATRKSAMVGLAGLGAHASTNRIFAQMTYNSRHQCNAGRLENSQVGLAAAKKLHYGRQT
jgi:hypothetical protein